MHPDFTRGDAVNCYISLIHPESVCTRLNVIHYLKNWQGFSGHTRNKTREEKTGTRPVTQLEELLEVLLLLQGGDDGNMEALVTSLF